MYRCSGKHGWSTSIHQFCNNIKENIIYSSVQRDQLARENVLILSPAKISRKDLPSELGPCVLHDDGGVKTSHGSYLSVRYVCLFLCQGHCKGRMKDSGLCGQIQFHAEHSKHLLSGSRRSSVMSHDAYH